MEKRLSNDQIIEELENDIKIQKNQIDGHILVIKGLQDLINNQKKCIYKLWIGR